MFTQDSVKSAVDLILKGMYGLPSRLLKLQKHSTRNHDRGRAAFCCAQAAADEAAESPRSRATEEGAESDQVPAFQDFRVLPGDQIRLSFGNALEAFLNGQRPMPLCLYFASCWDEATQAPVIGVAAETAAESTRNRGTEEGR